MNITTKYASYALVDFAKFIRVLSCHAFLNSSLSLFMSAQVSLTHCSPVIDVKARFEMIPALNSFHLRPVFYFN